MGNKRSITLFVLALAVFAFVGAVVYLSSPASEPVYHGKPLRYWFSDAANTSAIPPNSWNQDPYRVSDEAVGQVGTNAIPTLLRLLRATDSSLKLKLVSLARRQHQFKVSFTPADMLNARAAEGFAKLGPASANAIPALIQICDEHLSPDSETCAIRALGWCGPAASNAIPAIIRGVHSPSRSVQGQSLWALGAIHRRLGIVLPVLTNELQNTNLVLRLDAAQALRIIGPDAKASVPALIQILKDPDLNGQLYAAMALGEIRSDPAASVPALTAALHATNFMVLSSTLRALANFGPEAQSAVPDLLKLLDDPNPMTRGVAYTTLLAIAPETVRNAAPR